MVDVLDQLSERETTVLALQLAPRLETALCDDEKEALANAGRQCSDCGLPIPKPRLLAYPQAHRCVSCQLDWERGR